MKSIQAVLDPFRHAQISYAEKYLLLFSAFNAWYRSVTGERIDAHALKTLKTRDALWGEYQRGESLERIRPLIRKVMILSRVRPITPHGEWSGTLDGPDDWEGLIQFWYAIRCTVVHANSEIQAAYYPLYIQLAYESLNIFMTEIIVRMQQASLGDLDDQHVREIYGESLLIRRDHADMFARR